MTVQEGSVTSVKMSSAGRTVNSADRDLTFLRVLQGHKLSPRMKQKCLSVLLRKNTAKPFESANEQKLKLLESL